MTDHDHSLTDRLASLASRVTVESLQVGQGAPSAAPARRVQALRLGLAGAVLAGAAGFAVLRQGDGEQQGAAPPSSKGATPSTAPSWPLIDFADGPIEVGDRRLTELAASVAQADQTPDASTRVFISPDDRIVTLTTFAGAMPDFTVEMQVERVGYTEVHWPDSAAVTLTFEKGGVSYSVVGSDAALKEQFVQQIVNVGLESLATDPPGGLVEIPQPSGSPFAAAAPMLIGGGDEIAVMIESFRGSVYEFLADFPDRRRLDWFGGLDVWLGSDPTRNRASTGLIAVPGGGTVAVFGQTMSDSQVVNLIRRMQFVDEATWREHYGLPGADGPDATDATVDVTSPRASEPLPSGAQVEQAPTTPPTAPEPIVAVTTWRTIPPPTTPPPVDSSVAVGPRDVVYLAGDSDAGNLLTGLQPLIAERPTIDLQTFYKVSSGLSRPDLFDWPAQLERDLAALDPAVAVFAVGGNDAQDLEIDGAFFPVDSPEWKQEYARRVGAVMDLLAADGRRVVWVGVPNAVDAEFEARLAILRRITIDEALSRSIHYVDAAALFTGPDGVFEETAIDPVDGVAKPIRFGDGFHLNKFGSEVLARSLIHAIDAQLAD